MNIRFENIVEKGWRPTYHAEFLDLYNLKAQPISVTIKARINDSNSYVVIQL